MATPQIIKSLANDIRTKIKGKEVRESLARGIEEAGSTAYEAIGTANDAYDITQNLLDESFDTSKINQNFEQRLDNEIRNLQPEWTGFKDDVVEQISQIAINVETFAIQVPEANDSGRIQRAIDSMQGDVIFFPDGDFHLGKVKLRDNIKVIGSKNANLHLYKAGESLFEHSGTDTLENVSFVNLNLKGNGLEGYCIKVVNPKNFEILNCNIDLSNIGIELQSTDFFLNYDVNHNIRIIGNNFSQTEDSSLFAALNISSALHGGIISQNDFSDLKINNAVRIFVHLEISSSDWVISDNIFRNIYDPDESTGTGRNCHAIYSRSINTKIIGNTFKNVAGNNIDLQRTETSGTINSNFESYYRANIISNNTFVLGEESTFQGEGVLNLRCSDVLVDGNQFVWRRGSGKPTTRMINAQWGERLLVTNNNFRVNLSQATIQVLSHHFPTGQATPLRYKDVVIANNIFDDGNAEATININAYNDVDNLIITGNSFKGNAPALRVYSWTYSEDASIGDGRGQVRKLVYKNNVDNGDPFMFESSIPVKIDSDVFGTYTFYVDTVNGDDKKVSPVNNTPAKSLSRILDALPDCEFDVTIKLLNGGLGGEYISCNSPMGKLTIEGDVNYQEGYTIQRLNLVNLFLKTLTLKGFTLNNSGGHGIYADDMKVDVYIERVKFSRMQSGLSIQGSANSFMLNHCSFDREVGYAVSVLDFSRVLLNNTDMRSINSIRAQWGGEVVIGDNVSIVNDNRSVSSGGRVIATN